MERKNKELSKVKSELKKSKKLQLETVQQNNLLLAEMQKKDKGAERQEKKLQSEVKAQKAKLKEFFTEREQLKDEKRLWEETKLVRDFPNYLLKEKIIQNFILKRKKNSFCCLSRMLFFRK